MASHNELGKHGELLARHYLSENGFVVLSQNWRYSYYEVDVIASKDNILHFIEIKTRKTLTYGFPEDDVSRKKMENLTEAAEEYVFRNPQWKRVQFDIL